MVNARMIIMLFSCVHVRKKYIILQTYRIAGNMAKRETVNIRIDREDFERYRSWCSLMDYEQAAALRILMDGCNVPTLEQMNEFRKQFEPNSIRSPFE